MGRSFFRLDLLVHMLRVWEIETFPSSGVRDLLSGMDARQKKENKPSDELCQSQAPLPLFITPCILFLLWQPCLAEWV